MQMRYQEYFPKGILLILLFIMVTSVAAIRPDNTIYPFTNYFAFSEEGAITGGLNNQSYTSEDGMKIYEVTSDQDAYKLRFIFKTPESPFEMLCADIPQIPCQ